MHGSFALLVTSPIWLLFVGLELVCFGGMLAIRKATEGLAYNPAYSSFIGIQFFLIAIVLEAAYNLRHSAPSGTIASGTFQWIVGSVAILYALWRLFVYDNPADKYHQLVVMPLLIWLLGTTVPFLWTHGETDQIIVISLLGAFTCLVAIDVMTGRSKPRVWMIKHGYRLKGNYPTT